MFSSLLLLALSSPEKARAICFPQGWGEMRAGPFELHGFLLGLVSGRTTGLRPKNGEGGDFVLGEERLRLDLSGASPSGDASLIAKGDVLHDALEGEVDFDLREANAGYTYGPLDLRLGRQIVTWGIADLFFISDVFPKDWDSFFSGRPMEYLKLGVDGVQARDSSSVVNVEVMAIPRFTPDQLPSAERFFFFDPFSAIPNQHEREPASRLSNTELALRAYRELAGLDLSLYAYRGYWRTPGVRVADGTSPTTATHFFPKLSVYAASAQRSFWEGVLGLEAGYYDSREDRSGRNPAIANSQWRFLTSYQRQPWEDFTVSVQFYGEVMDEYGSYRDSLPPGSPRQGQFRAVSSVRLTQLLNYQTWKLGLFAAYSPTDDDYFLQLETSYRVTDSLAFSLGANLFGGRKQTTFFGQFEKSDNVFASARFDF